MEWLGPAIQGIGSFFNSGAGRAVTAAGIGLLNQRGIDEAADKQIDLARETRDLRRADLREGQGRARTLHDPFIQAGKPALGREAVTAASDPSKLTPGQQIALQDARRQTKGTLARTGNLGAGRAGGSVLADMENRMRAAAYDTNQARADRATTRLASGGQQSSSALANAELGVGSSLAGTNAEYGRTAGAIEGDEALSSAGNAGSVLGAIAGAMAADAKRRARASEEYVEA